MTTQTPNAYCLPLPIYAINGDATTMTGLLHLTEDTAHQYKQLMETVADEVVPSLESLTVEDLNFYVLPTSSDQLNQLAPVEPPPPDLLAGIHHAPNLKTLEDNEIRNLPPLYATVKTDYIEFHLRTEHDDIECRSARVTAEELDTFLAFLQQQNLPESTTPHD